MRLIKEWPGAFNSTLYLQETGPQDGKFLIISYGYSQTGNRYEGGEIYPISDLRDEGSNLVRLIVEDFGKNILLSVRDCVDDYQNRIEIKRW